MKIPNCYIKDINDIIKDVDQLDGGRLFLAYMQLSAIEDVFLCRDVPLEDATFERLIKVKAHIEILLNQKLAEYEVLKMRVKYYESKS